MLWMLPTSWQPPTHLLLEPLLIPYVHSKQRLFSVVNDVEIAESFGCGCFQTPSYAVLSHEDIPAAAIICAQNVDTQEVVFSKPHYTGYVEKENEETIRLLDSELITRSIAAK